MQASIYISIRNLTLIALGMSCGLPAMHIEFIVILLYRWPMADLTMYANITPTIFMGISFELRRAIYF